MYLRAKLFLANNLNLTVRLIVITNIMLSILYFLRSFYTTDFDHEMYFGKRLLQGELLWTREMHDKLPVVQFLFAFPAYFDSPLIFKLLNWLVIFFTSAAISKTLFIFKIPKAKHLKSENINILHANTFFFLTISSPNAIDMSINSIAVCMATMSILSTKKVIMVTNPKFKNILIAAIYAALAISIRPYFAGFFLVLFLLLGFVNYLQNSKFAPRHWGKNLMILLLTIGISFCINALPYFFTKQLNAFVDGLQFLTLDLLPIPFFRSLGQTNITYLFWSSPIILVSLVLLAWFIKRFKERTSLDTLMILELSSWLGMAAMFSLIAMNHWWPHYISLFIPGLMISLFSLKIWETNPKQEVSVERKGVDKWPTKVLLISIVAVSIVSGAVYVGPIRDNIFQKVSSHSGLTEFQYLQKEIGKSQAQKVTFLFPENMYFHWKLNESRLGLPHSVHISYILQGFWSKLDSDKIGIDLPINQNQICSAVLANKVDLILAYNGSQISQCDGFNLRYNKLQVITSGEFGPSIDVYEARGS